MVEEIRKNFNKIKIQRNHRIKFKNYWIL